MATPVPHIARKLPIKRKSPTQQPQPPLTPKSEPFTAPDAADDDEFDGRYDYNDDDGGGGAAAAAGDLKAPPPPFKFHRIWSEPDEIRFLQGLLGCHSQGLVFPRDLNLFYDRFSDSMPQPYTRSQLSEKLRRLRKKFRIMSARIARGQDPARLAPHDRDLLHLCTRLWDPAHAATSPFSPPPDGSAAPPVGNKRRRPNPRPLSARAAVPSSSGAAAAAAAPLLLLPADPTEGNSVADNVFVGIKEEEKPLALLPPPLTATASGDVARVSAGRMLAKTVLDVFDGVLNEMRVTLLGEGVVQPEIIKGGVQPENNEGVVRPENNEGAVQLENIEGPVLMENIEGAVQPENIEVVFQPENNVGVVLPENDKVAFQPENNAGAVLPENSEGEVQLENNVGVVLPENDKVAFQPENNVGAVLPENSEVAFQPENNVGAVLPENSEVAFQPENNAGAVLPENSEVAFQPENNVGAVLPEHIEEAVQLENNKGAVLPENSESSAFTGKDFTRRWQEQRLAELGVLASRLRLVIEDSIQG